MGNILKQLFPDFRYPCFLLASAGAYTLLLYTTPRGNFSQVLILYWGLFFLYFWATNAFGWGIPNALKIDLSLVQLLIAALLFRLIALFAVPELSDDYFRFIWDGRLLTHGQNPFLKLPSDWMTQPEVAETYGLTATLYRGLNSPDYFTIYPPVNQLIFWIATSVFPRSIYGSLLVMKIFNLLAELGSIYLLAHLLGHFAKPLNQLGFYALNPLVIIELNGNLHHEALVIFFLLLSLYLWVKGKLLWMSLPLAGAILSKLLPIILFPLFLRRIGWGKTILLGILTASICILAFLPVIDLETIEHLGKSIELYFQKFEFNASLYYLNRWWGFHSVGYNVIETAGKGLALLTVFSIFLYAYVEEETKLISFPRAAMWAFLIYFSCATIVHPWYITTLLALKHIHQLQICVAMELSYPPFLFCL